MSIKRNRRPAYTLRTSVGCARSVVPPFSSLHFTPLTLLSFLGTVLPLPQVRCQRCGNRLGATAARETIRSIVQRVVFGI